MKVFSRCFYLGVFILAFLMSYSCRREEVRVKTLSNHADSLIFDAGAMKDYTRMLELIDSFAQTNDITPIDANRWRGTVYYRKGQYRASEVYYKKALEQEPVTDEDRLCYIKAARRLSELLLVKGDYEGSLMVAMPAVKMMKETNTGSDIDFAILLNNIGCCQLNLGRDEEANESFITARGHYINRWSTDSTGRGFQEAVIGTIYTSQAYINMKRYAESLYWIDRTEMLLNKYRKRGDARNEYFDEYQGLIEMMRAEAKFGLEEYSEAENAYEAFRRTDFSKTSYGRITSNEFLVGANRFIEAADNYRYLDQMLSERGIELSLDNIQLYLLPKLRANIGAGRKDTVMVVASKLCDALDSAIVRSKDDNTAELATIYNTQEKDAFIARQQADLSRQRWVSTMVALALVVIFFSIYTYHRRKATQKITLAHEKLQKAYDQLEETTAVKERIESELRIARDIQMSMVPNVFPDHKGLDVFAAMNPAKEVGGDLYGYVLLNDMLYFCIGDVSGKGVPASLFMAQATRLFRTLASQGMMPDEIATHMNAELAEENAQGMFVTMFIGMANLNTGRLDFCNCGHNPPVVGGLESVASYLTVIPNAPLGLWPDLAFEGEVIEQFRGCPLLIYTDGLTEAENRQQEQFGEDRLIRFLSEGDFDCAKSVVVALRAEVEKFRNGAEPNDDLTIMCLKIN